MCRLKWDTCHSIRITYAGLHSSQVGGKYLLESGKTQSLHFLQRPIILYSKKGRVNIQTTLLQMGQFTKQHEWHYKLTIPHWLYVKFSNKNGYLRQKLNSFSKRDERIKMWALILSRAGCRPWVRDKTERCHSPSSYKSLIRSSAQFSVQEGKEAMNTGNFSGLDGCEAQAPEGHLLETDCQWWKGNDSRQNTHELKSKLRWDVPWAVLTKQFKHFKRMLSEYPTLTEPRPWISVFFSLH